MKWFSGRENFFFGLHRILVRKQQPYAFFGGRGLHQRVVIEKIVALRTLRFCGGNLDPHFPKRGDCVKKVEDP